MADTVGRVGDETNRPWTRSEVGSMLPKNPKEKTGRSGRVRPLGLGLVGGSAMAQQGSRTHVGRHRRRSTAPTSMHNRLRLARAVTRIVKTTAVIGAALLALIVTPAATAVASTGVHVPCEGGAVGLVDAINAANLAGGGTISLASGCTYTLTSVNNTAGMLGDGNGLPLITSRIIINGSDNETGNAAMQGENGNEGTTIAGIGVANGAGFRIFEVDGPGGNLTLNGLIITKGFGLAGGGILNVEGAATLNHSQVTGNTGAGGGGGIASGIVDPNHLGPIGAVTLNHSQVNGNIALGGGGGGILNRAGALTLNFSQVDNNISRGGGGGIASGTGNGGTAGDSKLILNYSQVNNNTSTGGPNAGAGGVANGGTAVITHSQVNHNTAPGASGGGILNHGTMTINLSEVNGNKAPKAGLNDDGTGGGIANLSFAFFGASTSGVLTINSSQVNDNSASGIGGGILEDGILPGPPPPAPPTFGAPGGKLILDHSQVTENSSADGGGIFSSSGSPASLVHATRDRDNTPNNCIPLESIPGCSG